MMNTVKGIDTSQEKLDMKKQLRKMISTTGSDIFNPGNVSSTNGAGNGTASFDQILEFMTAVMTKEYAEAVRIGELVLNVEPENKTVREFLPVLQKLMTISSVENDDSDSSSDSNSDGSSSESGNEDSLCSDSDNENENSKAKKDSGSGSGSDAETETSSESDSENSDSDSDSSETGSFSSGSDEVEGNVHFVPTAYESKAGKGDIAGMMQKTHL